MTIQPKHRQRLIWLTNAFQELFLILGITVFLLIAIHYAIGGARYVKHAFKGIKSSQAALEELKQSSIFAGFDHYENFFTEAPQLKLEPMPYYHWRYMPYVGTAVNIDPQGIRKTVKNPNPTAKKVFMFGGSTIWGTGVPDQYTIPSQLQALLGADYDVYNFGETAFVAAQELNLLLEHLANGFIPDLVIFYDGVSDTQASLFIPGRPRHPQFSADDYKNKEETLYLLKKLVEKTNYIALTERLKIWTKKDPNSLLQKNVLPNLEQNAKATVHQYAQFMRQVKALGAEYGFKTYHFWQPMLLTETRDLTEQEKKIQVQTNPLLTDIFNAVNQVAKNELDKHDNFFYIVDVFADVKEPLYFDFCHLGPKGNGIVAQRMMSEILSA